ncbi:MAG: vWA domain-containing protein [Pseudomonadota bacterium]
MNVSGGVRTAIRAVLATGLMTGLLAVLPQAAVAQAQKPLLVEGTSTIYQRVLAKDEAELFDQPGAGTQIETITPFQPLYVFARQGDTWLQVGRSLVRGPEGWMEAVDTVDWRQNIVVSFSAPTQRQRQLMFDTRASLLGVVEHESPIATARQRRHQVEQDGSADGVVTIEPETAVPLEENFYLLPILDWEEYLHTATWNENMRLLRVASLPLKDEAQREVEEAPLSAGIVFVMDTTVSMQPFIDETRDMVRDIISQIQGTPEGENVRFGAVGFRDSVEAALAATPPRDVEYRTRTFLELTPDQSAADIESSLAQMVEAEASTVGYDEDAIAGVIDAIEMEGWDTAGPNGEPIALRYVIVVSDASPHHPRHPHAAHTLVPAAVLQRAKDKNITLVAIHIISADGALNHEVAEGAYSDMTRVGDTDRPFYIPVDVTAADADVRAEFRQAANPIVDQFVMDTDFARTQELEQASEERDLTVAEEASLAMRLAWLGRQTNASAPDVIEAWTLDYSLEDPTLPALDVRLLVTKNELATMRDIMKEIVAAGEMSRAGGDFFSFLRGAFARMATDQGQLVNTEFDTLDEAVGEFLAELPYRSEIMDITPEEWASLGTRRTAILDRVYSAMTQFEFYHDNPDYWVELYPGQDPGEYVFAMPLEDLP